jgi:hypothetical protein
LASAVPDGRAEQRHPLIWIGIVHFDDDMMPVRLRNISSIGAMIETPEPLPEGAEVRLDLGDAGALPARVLWMHGGSCGPRLLGAVRPDEACAGPSASDSRPLRGA